MNLDIGDARPKLLIVDDQILNIRLLAAILEESYELFFATDGNKAIEIATEQDIELVLLDVVMPGMDGYEVCRRLKSNEKTKEILVIFVTAMNEVEDETCGFDVGGVDYINKPISPPRVQARVKTHLELKRTRDRLEKLAVIDPLTGVGNRRSFDQQMGAELRRAVRSQAWLSVLIADVDFFKQFNDSYGHSRGDECLKRIAQALVAAAGRSSDLVARYGGEEFGIILPETDFEGASRLTQSVLSSVGELKLPHANSAVAPHVTVSVGAVSLVPSETSTADCLFSAADDLLYQAKQGGRNRGVHLNMHSDTTATLHPVPFELRRPEPRTP